jgi:hypothetical protein
MAKYPVVRIGMMRPAIFMEGGRGRVGVDPDPRAAFGTKFGAGGGFGAGRLPGVGPGDGFPGTGPCVPSNGMTGSPC